VFTSRDYLGGYSAVLVSTGNRIGSTLNPEGAYFRMPQFTLIPMPFRPWPTMLVILATIMGALAI
jgi:hypothetical protein